MKVFMILAIRKRYNKIKILNFTFYKKLMINETIVRNNSAMEHYINFLFIAYYFCVYLSLATFIISLEKINKLKCL